MKVWTLFVFAVLVLGQRQAPAGDASDGQRWWSHVLVLADDKLEGRDTGSEGHRKAAEYVARRVRAGRASSPPGPRGISSRSG